MNMEHKKAISDLTSGLENWRIWLQLAWITVREKYQRSVLGPFWITLSTLVTVLTFGLLYGRLLGRDLSEHLIYVSLGMIIWTLYSDIVVKGCHVFISNGRMIQQLPLPYSTHIYKLITTEFISFLHNCVIIIAIFAFFGKAPTITSLLAIPGLILILLNAASFALIFGTISLRFRDFPPIVQAAIRPMMFFTPIIWNADAFPSRAALIYYNPFYHIIELFRAPLLGHLPTLDNWVVVISITIISMASAFALFSKYRRRIAYWV